MAAYIEVMTCEGGRAILEAGSIAGLITPPGADCFTVPTQDSPLRLILRGGECLDVMGESAAKILVRSSEARKLIRATGQEILVDYIEASDGSTEPFPEVA